MLDYHWNVREPNLTNNHITDFMKYGPFPQTVSSGYSFNIQFDNRANLNNPQKGTYTNILFRSNYKFLRSDQNWHSLLIEDREVFSFP